MDTANNSFECYTSRTYSDHWDRVRISKVLERLNTAFAEPGGDGGTENRGGVSEGRGCDVEDLQRAQAKHQLDWSDNTRPVGSATTKSFTRAQSMG